MGDDDDVKVGMATGDVDKNAFLPLSPPANLSYTVSGSQLSYRCHGQPQICPILFYLSADRRACHGFFWPIKVIV